MSGPDDVRVDRVRGVLAGQACGDALGAGYEFGPPLGDDVPVGMVGGGVFAWEPGEWTDDTQMSTVLVAVGLAAAEGGSDLLASLDDVTAGWAAWARTAADVGAQTRSVLTTAASTSAADVAAAARAHLAATGRAGGNGSLMRTAPVALAYLSDPVRRAEAARVVSDLTHPDPIAGDACVLWCDAIARAVSTGVADVRAGLPLLPAERRGQWQTWIDEAEAAPPVAFHRDNGWVVSAFRAAWSAVVRGRDLPSVLDVAVRGGSDTDTVAAIAGALAGAVHGWSGVPQEWRDVVHGWPGWTVAELAERGVALAR
ncbi:ADP-ribosylglycohydrolase family protein [Cellulomonas sp. JZ18]|uniref:ADP-ribosylglycohydrolase family protein n=1 Tax=Cellulomonas sp. JZ18 TaxID=2654191 RepID=UPI001E56EFA3|nr:ADP-ribosylglycohydrolase family protein [Cellulomonas sp. JZ18]